MKKKKEYQIKTYINLPKGGIIGTVSLVSDMFLAQSMVDDIYKKVVENQANSLVNRIFMEGISALDKKK